MTTEITGPHELQTTPPVALARDIIERALLTSNRLRDVPIQTVRLAAKLAPFATVRTSLAVMETLMRRALGDANDNPEVVAPGLYPGPREGVDREAFTAPPDAAMSIHSIATELLDRSVRQSPKQAVEANYKRLLLQLVPDEARILNALADGRPRVMQHVGPGTFGGAPDSTVLRFASPVGIEAGVRCPESVPAYVKHLVQLDLVTIGPEMESLREQYEILDTFNEVEVAEEAATEETKGFGKKMKLKTAVRERRSITLSELGTKLWEAASPDSHAFARAEQRSEPEIDMSVDLPPEPET